MSEAHNHAGDIRFEQPLWVALGLTCLFLIAEVVGGVLTNSLALLSDAAHMATDALALGVSLTAVRLSRRPPDARRSYGYVRMEALGAFINGSLLFLVAIYILWEAVSRLRAPLSIASTGMLVIAVVGLVVNLIAMRLLKAGSGDSLNVKGAYLEVWGDMLGSIGVIVAAVVIWLTGWAVADPIIAALIGLFVLPRAWTLLRQAANVLMQGVPEGVNMDAVRQAIVAFLGVGGVHKLHVWALGSTQAVLTAHVVADPTRADPEALRRELATLLRQQFDIEHTTLQVEAVACGDGVRDVVQP